MTQCKQCASTQKVKNGKVRGKQRYRCKHCGYNYVEGDERLNASLVVKKALAILLYAIGKSSCGMLGTIFGVSRWACRSNGYRCRIQKYQTAACPELEKIGISFDF